MKKLITFLKTLQISEEQTKLFLDGTCILEKDILNSILNEFNLSYELKSSRIPYILINHENIDIQKEAGFAVNLNDILNAINYTNEVIYSLPFTIFQSIDFKSTSGMIGALFCKGIESHTSSIVNPIEKGYPDILPDCVDPLFTNPQLMNYHKGIEVKSTLPGVPTGTEAPPGTSRLETMKSITWQAHHREGKKLLGLTWDFVSVNKDNNFHPIIVAVFYSDNLSEEDWGQISGTNGRNTKVSGLKSSGKKKMGDGCLAILNSSSYISKIKHILKPTTF